MFPQTCGETREHTEWETRALLFTNVLVPYGKYFGYWAQSSSPITGGLVHVYMCHEKSLIIGEKITGNNNLNNLYQSGGDEDSSEDEWELDEDNDFNDNPESEETKFSPRYERTRLFEIDLTKDNLISCFCNGPNDIHAVHLTWIQTIRPGERCFGLSTFLLTFLENKSGLLTHEHGQDVIEDNDLYFRSNCSKDFCHIYHPIQCNVKEEMLSSRDWSLSRLEGIWVGDYGGHGPEFLYLNTTDNFVCPLTISNGVVNRGDILNNVLTAIKISGDPNIPRGKVSFAALKQIEVNDTKDENVTRNYYGIGQIASHGYKHPQYIRAKVAVVSNDKVIVSWYQLNDISTYNRLAASRPAPAYGLSGREYTSNFTGV
ncbi:unnamed protein product [Didymodactylos carnosus]|uniref:Uncharacterized protein n=1 Tax=Didymodactylos carnosus TaxID=1234261 RepID=A0A814EMT0_9BILA|nr:unnamed protein product [Didymodactylos carnosus]CAF3746346.1 unnamed protein product [Didymodactylos carnosus]